MKKLFFFILLSCLYLFASAEHLKGGFFTYKYLGQGSDPTKLRYSITLTVYMNCNAEFNPGQLSNPIPFTIYNAGTGQFIRREVPISQRFRLSKSADEECIDGDQRNCYYYIVIYDLPDIELDANTAGYVISYQRCCRIIDIKNVTGNSSTYGNTYSIKIPGSNVGQNAQQNSSASFQVNDTAVICRNSFFQYPFLATDSDNDSLSYSFCEAWTGGGQGNGTGPNSSAPDPAAPPSSFAPLQYPIIPYAGGYSGGSPLGPNVTINPRTGMISGIAPSLEGQYVITVCVNEYRNGVLIATNRKELHITVGDCGSVSATLDPSYITCDGLTLNFANNTPTGVNTYFWDFGEAGIVSDTSTAPNPTHQFFDSGTYTITLIVNRGEACPDTTTAIAKVYPGFFPGFTFAGVCVNKPTQFTDTTNTRYGFVNTWRWDFGDTGNADTSQLQHPTYTYTTPGTKNVTFIVSNSKGCTDTIPKQIEILTKPPLSVAFKDTLICAGDSMQLGATGTGLFTWTPVGNIINANTPDPVVFPQSTTDYVVQLDDQGCLATETVKVRVVSFVTLQAMADTIICATDSVQLRAVTDGLRYTWNNAGTLSNPNILQPMAKPVDAPTVYTITATIGKCSAQDDVVVTLVPYPIADAGNDTIICYNTAAQLNGTIVGNSHTWSPTNTLSNATTLTPIATPRATTAYILSAFDTRGCPKPGKDTVIVVVNPEVVAFAGTDTAIVAGQPLQFNATGGVSYQWSPGTALSSTTIPDPRAVYNGEFDSIRYHLVVADAIGCTDDASVLVKIFRTNPQVFVPTAFTPNGDGKNEIVAPIAVGLSRLDYFRIYNRWGQLVFETTINGKGWDGKIAGKEQGNATYVWIVKGTDYTGKVVFEKGTVTLIR
jgi:gliding motility-associated-like protein